MWLYKGLSQSSIHGNEEPSVIRVILNNKISRKMKRGIFILLCILCIGTLYAHRWQLCPAAGIIWKADGNAHSDHIEMSGKQVSVVLRYGINEAGNFVLNKGMVWPLLRTIPNNTHASLMQRLSWNPLETVIVDGQLLNTVNEKVRFISLDGTMNVWSDVNEIEIKRTFTPSVDLPGLIEIYQLKNTGKRKRTINIPEQKPVLHTAKEKGVTGSYRIEMTVAGSGLYTISPGDSITFSAMLAAYKSTEKSVRWNAHEELKKRKDLLKEWSSNLVLETPDSVLNRMFAFSKIRACESIFATKGGPMHGPGGESFYAAIWANDQAEYINPYFPFVGYEYGCESAMNSFRHFARFINDKWEPIPSSIIAEGDDIWNGAGDRGDAAMIAYGAARYALASGNKEEAKQLWPLIEWCLEFCHRKLNSQGVVASDSDELEGRFPAGKANLCTSSLYYDALLSASYLANDLGKPSSVTRTYHKQATFLAKAIDDYFAAKVEGYNTYAYYKENDILRSWICIPLTVGIYTHAEGTIDALFSPRLWTDNGLLTQAGSNTFWDRSTLYALRGVFMAGEIDKAMKFFRFYSQTRLLGNHVPYAIEAWPEGNQRHLSAESALYGRIVTEGMFGIRPIGLHSFEVSPRMPKEWNKMALKHVRICANDFDIQVVRQKEHIYVEINKNGKSIARKSVKDDQPVKFKF